MFYLEIDRKTLDQLKSEREELEKMYRLAESLENQKRDEEKTKTLQQMVSEKGSKPNENAKRFQSNFSAVV